MNNARKRMLEWCKLLPKPGADRKRWKRMLNHREIRQWVHQERALSPLQRRAGELCREAALDLLRNGDLDREDLTWFANGYFLRSRKQRLWMEAVMRGEIA